MPASRTVRVLPTPAAHPASTTPLRRHALWESVLQLSFNLTVAAIAIGALVQILPDRRDRRVRLAQLEANVQQQEVQVDRLRERFAYYFDPAQFQSLIREESQKIHPQQRPIVWVGEP